MPLMRAHLSCAWRVANRALHLIDIGKRQPLAPHFLVGLMPLARHQNDIARVGGADARLDGQGAVRPTPGLPRAAGRQNLVDDGLWRSPHPAGCRWSRRPRPRPPLAAAAIKGRLLASRSPPQPNTHHRRPPRASVSGRRVDSALANASGVWA